jgi:hypothetical protein
LDLGRLFGLLSAKEKINTQKAAKASSAAASSSRDSSLTMPGDLAAISPPI